MGKLRICVTGATGFVGQNLIELLSTQDDLEIVALSRKVSYQMDNSQKGNIIWRRCNGFSLIDVEKATKDVDVLIYLIHSMLPTSALSQGDFPDFDLYLADNFARAAATNKIKKIIYLSGLIPPAEKLSEHLKSRLEVESALSQYGNDVSVLRAGLVVGENGSSFKILERLIKRLPVLICPQWTLSKTQPISLHDVLASLNYCIRNYQNLRPVYDIAGPDIVTYKEMLILTAKILGIKRPIINVPMFSPGLSKLWVSKITTTEASLVYPLIESLKHEMIADKDQQLIIPDHKYKGFRESLEKALSKEKDGIMRYIVNYNAIISFRLLESVSSFQRIVCSKKTNGEEVANNYFKWLPKFLSPFINVKVVGGEVSFLLFNKLKLLILTKNFERSTDDRVLYYITGGLLARLDNGTGRMEFRWIGASNSVICALIDYRPSLPWFIYKYTQAYFHLIVMKRFAVFQKNQR